MADPQCLDPTLLTARERDKKAELDKLSLAEMLVQPLPQGVVCDAGVPDDGARVNERRLLSFAESVRVLKVQELLVLLFGDRLLSRPDRSLYASILALD